MIQMINNTIELKVLQLLRYSLFTSVIIVLGLCFWNCELSAQRFLKFWNIFTIIDPIKIYIAILFVRRFNFMFRCTSSHAIFAFDNFAKIISFLQKNINQVEKPRNAFCTQEKQTGKNINWALMQRRFP